MTQLEKLVDIGDKLVVGRLADCGYVVADDMRLSRRHFRLRWQGLGLWMEDLRSLFGTFVKGNQPRSGAASLRRSD